MTADDRAAGAQNRGAPQPGAPRSGAVEPGAVERGQHRPDGARPAPSDKPAVTKPEATPSPPSSGVPHTGGRAVADSATHPMIGRNALSSDGNKVGDVRAVKTTPDGRITAIQLKVGGFLGFGGRIVEVPEDKFMQKGEVITIDYTLDEANKLPEANDAS